MDIFFTNELVIVPVKKGLALGVVVDVDYDMVKVRVNGQDEEYKPRCLTKIQNVNDFTVIEHVKTDDMWSIDICPARQMAAKCLTDSHLTGDLYYKTEDMVTEVLNGGKR